MTLTLIAGMRWLHILAGMAWFGGYIFMDFVLWHALLRRPTAEAKATYDAVGARAGPLMAASGTLVVILGVLLGVIFGPLTSFGAIFVTAYALTWLVALVIALLLSV
jgi:copper resistance protein D